jgi:hypothetical protein
MEKGAGMRLCLVGAGLIATTGCVSTNASVLNPSVTYQKICPDGVQIFTSAERVRGEYYEVAILNSKGESSWTDEKQMTASQRNKAARLGANGIILGEVTEPRAGTKIIGSIFGTGAERKGAGLAIYIPADSNRVRRACSGNSGTNSLPADEDQSSPAAFGEAARVNPPPLPTPAGQRPAPDRRAARHAVRGRYREEGLHARALHVLHSRNGAAESLLLPDGSRGPSRRVPA